MSMSAHQTTVAVAYAAQTSARSPRPCSRPVGNATRMCSRIAYGSAIRCSPKMNDHGSVDTMSPDRQYA